MSEIDLLNIDIPDENLNPEDELWASLLKAADYLTLEQGIIFTKKQLKQFYLYFKHLLIVNQHMNLTAITKPKEVAELHFLDSLLVLPYFPISEQNDGQDLLKVIDIGTGAGLPGIPLKIAMPEMTLTLLDATRKRLAFLQECLKLIGLDERTMLLHARAEVASKEGPYREQFDIAIARAVAALPALVEYCLPFVKPFGYFIAMKGKLDQELTNARRAIQLLGGEVVDLIEFKLPFSEAERSLLIIQKIKETPIKYPRNASLIKRKPL